MDSPTEDLLHGIYSTPTKASFFAVSSTKFTPWQDAANDTVAKTLASISSVLSMLGAMTIIITYIAWKEIRSSSRKILVYISIADFFTAYGNMMSVIWKKRSVSDIPCKVQSFITTTSSMWSFFWTVFLAMYLYISIAKRRPKLAERTMVVFHVFGWFVPLGITIAAAVVPVTVNGTRAIGVLGNDYDSSAAGWCWIRSNIERKKQLMWMLVTGKAWEIASYFLIMVIYLVLKWHIYREVHYKREQFITTSSLDAAIKADRKLTFIPVLFIILRIWGTTRFLLFSVDSSATSSWLVYLQGIGDSGQGFANFMLFCFFTQKFQNKLKKSFSKICTCLARNTTSVEQETSNTNKAVHDVNEKTINETSPLLNSMEHHPPNVIRNI